MDVPLHMPQEAFEGFLAGGLQITEIQEDEETTEESGEGVAIKKLDLLDVFVDQLNYRNVIIVTLQNVTSTFVNSMTVEASIYREGKDDVLYEDHAK